MMTPCDMEFSRMVDLVKNELHMTASLPKLHIHLTPPNIKLLQDVINILRESTAQVRIIIHI